MLWLQILPSGNTVPELGGRRPHPLEGGEPPAEPSLLRLDVVGIRLAQPLGFLLFYRHGATSVLSNYLGTV